MIPFLKYHLCYRCLAVLWWNCLKWKLISFSSYSITITARKVRKKQTDSVAELNAEMTKLSESHLGEICFCDFLGPIKWSSEISSFSSGNKLERMKILRLMCSFVQLPESKVWLYSRKADKNTQEGVRRDSRPLEDRDWIQVRPYCRAQQWITGLGFLSTPLVSISVDRSVSILIEVNIFGPPPPLL